MKRRRKKKQPPRRPLSKWWRVVWAFIPAIVLLIVAEVSLRLAGFHHPASFFIPGADGFVDSNERFAFRFMAPELARDPLPCHFAAAKPAGTIRIFILGESAAMGVPDPAFGFGRILEVMLRQRYPDKQFEVINTGVTAINSHAIREIALDALQYDPDLLVIYAGNNEVVGPFGPGTIFQSGMPSLGFIRFQLWLSRSAIWQALSQLAASISANRAAPRQWNGMEMFVQHRVGPDDPRLDKVLAHFGANLSDILRAARNRSVPVVICTVPVNLEACPPLASEHRRGLSDTDEQHWNEFYSSGTNAEAHGDWAAAEKSYTSAEQLDSLYAEVDFRRARCLDELGRTNDAAQEFSAARDHDALRFRADSRLNAKIRELARDAGPDVRLYDTETDFARNQADLFYEHVHMTFAGNYRLAAGFLPRIETPLGLVPLTQSWATEEECARKLAYTPWSRWKTTKQALAMMLRPPFTMQLDYDRTFPEKVQAMDQAGTAVSSPDELDKNVAAYDAALKDRPDDFLIRRNLLGLLDQRGDFDREVAEARTLMNTPPPRSQSVLRYGDALLHDGKVRDAIPVYREVIRMRPDEADPRQALGDALLQTGASDDALAAYQAAGARGDDTPEFHNNLATLLMNKGDLDAASEHLERALQWTQNPIWRANLGGLYYKQGKFEAALDQFRQALSGMSDSPALHDNIGLTLMALGRKRAAANQFEEALRIDPGFDQARGHLQQLVTQH